MPASVWSVSGVIFWKKGIQFSGIRKQTVISSVRSGYQRAGLQHEEKQMLA